MVEDLLCPKHYSGGNNNVIVHSKGTLLSRRNFIIKSVIKHLYTIIYKLEGEEKPLKS